MPKNSNDSKFLYGMKKLFIYILVSLTLSVAIGASAASVILTPTSSSTKPTTVTILETIFTRSLTLGSSGRDVMALKKILKLELNSATDTSPTFTTNTASDIKKLQEKYAVEILIPNGLSAGTGYVGPSTIKKLNDLASKYIIRLSDFVLPATVASVRTIFTNTLAIGSNSDEVALLKTILNADESTALIPKNSTNIFDVATALAVKRFQEKYRSEILIPLGLTNGTGMVGPSTRAKLNALLNKNLASIISTSTVSVVISSVNQQTFSVSGGSFTNNGPIDGDILSKTCDGTTLVVKKIGFGSTYDIRTAFAGECANFSVTLPSNIQSSIPSSFDLGVCEKTTYTIGAWGACGFDGKQTRSVSGIVGTTSCSFGYFDQPAPSNSQSCAIPSCPSDVDVSFIGNIDSYAPCINVPLGLTVIRFKGNTQFVNMKTGNACLFDEGVIYPVPSTRFSGLLGFGPIPGQTQGLGIPWVGTGEITPLKTQCLLINSDRLNYRILNLSKTQIDPKVNVND